MSLHILVVIAYAAIPATANVDRLPRKLEKAVGQVSVAYAQNQPIVVLKVLGPLCARLKGKNLDAFNRALQKQRIPPVSELLVGARLELLEANRANALPKTRLSETLLILRPLLERVESGLARAAKPTEAAAEIDEPVNLAQYETLLSSLGLLQEQLRTTELTARYAQKLADRVSARTRARLEPEAQSLFAEFDGKAIHDAGQLRQQLLEREIKLRLKRLAYGITILENPSLTKERFLAAHASGIDAKILQTLLQPDQARKPQKKVKKPQKQEEEDPPPPRFVSDELNRPELPEEVAEQGKRAAELAGDLARKTSLFFEGLDWWLRGRFGRGPAVGGFAKSEAAAKKAGALFVLEMPVKFPKLEEPRLAGGAPKSHIDRRHHYIWAWQDRRLIRSSKIFDTGLKYEPLDWRLQFGSRQDRQRLEESHHPTQHLTSVQSTRVPPLQRANLYRLVGFIEYGKALDLLDAFVREASPKEFDVADQIVRDHEEFLIYTNLSRKIEQPSSLTEHVPVDELAKLGLNWILALARVERGAMLAGFTDIEHPFPSTPPQLPLKPLPSTPPQPPLKPDKERDRRTERVSAKSGSGEFGKYTHRPDAYREMLTDALRTHYWALMQDPEIRKYNVTGIPENHLLTYGRRTYVTLRILDTVGNYSAARWSGEQLAELTRWQSDIENIHRKYVYCLSLKYSDVVTQAVGRRLHADPGKLSGVSLSTMLTDRKHSRLKVGKSRKVQNPLTKILLQIDPTLAACSCQ
jgi:hypothetical protein